jgi:acetyl esterase/lipase
MVGNKLFRKNKSHGKKHFPTLKVAVLGFTGLVLVVAGVVLLQYLSRRSAEEKDHTLPLAITNLAYCNGEKLDLYVPQSATAVPVVIYIHGGGWKYGSKVGGMFPQIKPLINNSFAVASINYRLSDRTKFPGQIEDTLCAVRFLRSQATIFNLDKNAVGVIGISAGGHLAALAATASDQATFIKGGYEPESSEVQAAVIISGLLELTDSEFNKVTKQNITDLLGKAQDTQVASPSNYLSKGDAPMLLMYGDHDRQVPKSQSLNFVSKAQSLGVPADSVEVKSATHNLDPYFALNTKPSAKERLKLLTTFFNQNLRP